MGTMQPGRDKEMSAEQKSIRIILVDTQRMALGNIRAAVELSAMLEVVGQATNSQDAVQLCQITQPDVALINLSAPDLDGIGVIHWLVRQQPQVLILVLSEAGDEEQIRAALDAGAAGYLPGEGAPEALASTIEHVMEGKRRTAANTMPEQGAAQNGNAQEGSGVIGNGSGQASEEGLRGLRTAELVEAARIQTSLLPGEAPVIPGWDVAVKLQPARETSGDFYDFLPLEHGKYGIVIGDVSDKGLGAALFMAMTSTLFRTYISRQPSLPALTISTVNDRIISDSGGSSFVTAFLGVLEPNTGRLRYVNAGHVPPVMFGAQKGKSIDHLGRTGMALGVLKEASWQQKLVKFVPGDYLLLFTDGILDAEDRAGNFYGEGRLLQAARARAGMPARKIVEGVLDEVAVFTGGAPVSDDVILMALCRLK